MDLKRFAPFAGKAAVTHAVTYLVIGGVAYQLLTKQFYEGPNPIFAAFMRTPADLESWQHVSQWFVPGQILRGLLMAAALYPFFDTLCQWRFLKRFLSIAGLYLVFGFWASTVAAPGTIEGMIYMRPAITPYAHAAVQPEVVLQGLALAAWLGWWMAERGIGARGRHAAASA